MKSWKKFLIVSLSFLFVVTSVLAGLANFVKVDNTSNNGGKQNQESGVVTPSSPDNYDGMVYYASESEETGALEAPREWKGGAIYIDNGSNFVMDGGTLSNHEGVYGGAVYVANGGTFTMTGGTIEYNYSKYGGAVYVEAGGTFIIEDGDIVNNLAENAAAIYVEAGGNLKISANAYVNANEHIIVQDTLIHYYVDGEHVYSRNQLMPAFNLGKAPLDYENCNGYFLDEEMTIPVELNDDLTEIETNSSVQSMVAQNTTDGRLEFNLYTRTATLDLLSFSKNNSTNEYCVNLEISSTEKVVVVPRIYNDCNITKLNSGCFKNNIYINEVYIPSTISAISTESFYGAKNLTKVNLTNNITVIGSSAFKLCENIEEIKLPKNLTKIWNNAFSSCLNLSKVYIFSNNISSISSGAFENCLNLKSVSVSSVNSFAKINYENGTANPFNNLDCVLYEKNELVEFLNLNTVTCIGNYAFYGCSSIKVINIDNSVKGISNYSFQNCLNLNTVIIKDSLTNIGSGAFANCTNIEKVYVSDVNKYAEITFHTETSSPFYQSKAALYENDVLVEILDLDTATKASSFAFYGCSSIKELNIGSSVNSTGYCSFRNCDNLSVVNIDNGLKTIGNDTFRDTAITNIIIPNTVTTIGTYAFYNCIFLKNLTIPNSVTDVPLKAIENCSIENLNISTTVVQSITFQNLKTLKTLIIGDETTSISKDAFNGCTGLKTVIIGDGVKIIYTNAFYRCQDISYLELGESISSFGVNAFTCSSLRTLKIKFPDPSDLLSMISNNTVTEIYLGAKVKNIPTPIISNAVNLETIVIDENNNKFTDGNCNAIIRKSDMTLIQGSNSTVISENITSIGSNAFSNCKKLTNIVIPNNVTSVGSNAFLNCDLLINVEINGASIQTNSFLNCPIEILKINYSGTLPTIFGTLSTLKTVHIGNYSGNSDTIKEQVVGQDAFSLCSSLENVYIYDGVTSFGKYSFARCPLFKNLSIKSNNLTFIDSFAFSNSVNIEKVNVSDVNKYAEITFNIETSSPFYQSKAELYENDVLVEILDLDTATKVSSFAFYGCSSIKELNIGSSVNSTGYCSFRNCDNLSVVNIDNGLKTIGNDAFRETNIERVLFPYSLESIGVYAFYNCLNLIDLVFNENLISIGYFAFYGCVSLYEIRIPANVCEIGKAAFSKCDNLRSIIVDDNNAFFDSRNDCNAIISKQENVLLHGCYETEIPKTVEVIGEKAFMGISTLTDIFIPEGVKVISYDAFRDCVNLSSVGIKAYLLIEIRGGAFMNCSSLESFTIPSSVTTIEEEVFLNCTNLRTIEFSLTVNDSSLNIGYNTFKGCTSLEKIYIPAKVEMIYADNAEQSLFYGCDEDLKIYMGAIEQPEGFSEFWDYRTNTAQYEKDVNIYWGYTKEQYESLN